MPQLIIGLTIGQRQALEQQLKATAARLRNEIAGALRANGSSEAVGLANHLENIDDAALASLETGLEIAEVERDIRELRQVEDALLRMATPQFGLCQDCQADIGFQRLNANPSASRCLACQSSAEKATGARPHSL
jgi:RNA polymerase-binding transcription factor DksA